MDGYPVAAWFNLLAFAALIGAGGQGARVIVGIKKLNDAASAQTAAGVETGDLLVASKLLVSLAIGAIAGGIAAATTMVPGASLTGEHIAGLAAAGYAGADFIEGFISRASPAPGAPAGQEAIGTGLAAGAPVDATDDAVG
jgi:hypothetical protein